MSLVEFSKQSTEVWIIISLVQIYLLEIRGSKICHRQNWWINLFTLMENNDIQNEGNKVIDDVFLSYRLMERFSAQIQDSESRLL